MSNLVIIAVAVFETSCGKTDRQTNATENPTLATTVAVDNKNHIICIGLAVKQYSTTFTQTTS